MPPIRYWPCWTYFDRVLGHPEWPRLKILDFGCGWGNLLRDPARTTSVELYWGVDVRRDALELARRDYPQAHWIHYDRWNPTYNPAGTQEAPLPLNERGFDLVLAHSVFTHTSRGEMEHTVMHDLLPRLGPDGRAVVTFLRPDRMEYFVRTYGARSLDGREQERARHLSADGFYLVDYRYVLPLEADLGTGSYSLVTFYSGRTIASLWNGINVSITPDEIEGQWALILQGCVTARPFVKK